MKRKIVINAPAPKPKDLHESIRSIEQTAQLLRTLKANGVSEEERSKMIISDIFESSLPQKVVDWSEYQIIVGIRKALQVPEHEAVNIHFSIVDVLTQTLASGQHVKLNKLGTLGSTHETEKIVR
ncbi:MAG: hypothetical protein FPO08_00020 [Geobacter sp.]|nr:MAG: hypothetical protein FPO08_00020 [Geobacter sp.]